MEFTQLVTGGAFLVLYAVIAVGTWTSPMPTNISAFVSVGLLLFGLVTLLLGVKHGEYRAGTAAGE